MVHALGMAEPRVVFFDLETLPIMKAAMRVFPRLGDYPGLTLKSSINSVICFGYKILGEKQVRCLNAWDFKSWRKDVNNDRELIEASLDILRSADAVVTHNGKRFDWKVLRTRALIHGIGQLPKIPHIDTCAVAKQHMLSFNNKLDTLAELLGTERKLENGGWDLWCKVMERDEKAMALMTKYCKQDVEALSQVFHKLRPFVSHLPNYNLFTQGLKHVCPTCGSTRLQGRGHQITKTNSYRRYQCQDCGSWSRTDVDDKMPRAL
jgi:DNA polymerase elongation subunit (family B)/DNA-directed RNA polymerase subunit RPC12/RpoP